MTTYTIHENAGSTTEIRLIEDTGVTYYSRSGLVFSLGLNSHYGSKTISDTLIIDGTYSGDAEGSFGLVREIEDRRTFTNESGELHIADKIRNEYWFNISATPFIPLNEELMAEHNLTFEYTSPQIDWDNRTFRYTFVEDNGSKFGTLVNRTLI